MPSPPQPTTSTLSPGFTFARRRPDPGWHAAGHQAREIERNVLVDDQDRGLIDHGAFGESADHAKGTDVGAIPVAPAVAAVELLALGNARSFGAQVMQTAAAPLADAAGRNEGEHNVIATLD
jgi:hypothetical protein